MSRPLRIVAYGGGTNSTALILGCFEKGIRIDLILFADTGGERPETYEYIKTFSRFCVNHGLPEIFTVRRDGASLEKHCIDLKMLPSLAYGYKSCSDKFKQRPQNNFVRSWPPALKTWAQGEKILKLIGIDAGEAHRAHYPEQTRYIYQYPLIDWNWAREECIEAIRRNGLPQPGKSSCFFCPAMKKKEILALQAEHPELIQRAIAIEDAAQANLTSIKGLGRRFSWRDFLFPKPFDDRGQGRMFTNPPEIACMCFDGESP